MAIKEKDKSLLEIAIGLVSKKRGACKLSKIIEEVMEVKGYKGLKAKDHTAQFLLDFMQSGYFVYCGDDCWDLKERQATSVIDKDGADYEKNYSNEKEVLENELKDDMYKPIYEDSNDDDDDDNDEEDDDIARELNELDDDLSSEFENVSYDEEETEEEDEL